jgi:hypothetical protein
MLAGFKKSAFTLMSWYALFCSMKGRIKVNAAGPVVPGVDVGTAGSGEGKIFQAGGK